MRGGLANDLVFALLATMTCAGAFAMRPVWISGDTLWAIVLALSACSYVWRLQRRTPLGVYLAPCWMLLSAILIGVSGTRAGLGMSPVLGATPAALTGTGLSLDFQVLWSLSSALMISGVACFGRLTSAERESDWPARLGPEGRRRGARLMAELGVFAIALGLSLWLGTSARYAGPLAIWGFFLGQSLRRLQCGPDPAVGPLSLRVEASAAKGSDPFVRAAASLRAVLEQA